MKGSAKGPGAAGDQRATSPLWRPLSPAAWTRNQTRPSGAVTPWGQAATGRAPHGTVLSPRSPARPRGDVPEAKRHPPARAALSPPGAGGHVPWSPTLLSSLHQTTVDRTTEHVEHSKLADKPNLLFGLFPDDEEGSLEYAVHMAAYTVAFAAGMFFITFAASAYFPHCDKPVGCFDLGRELRQSRLVDVDPCDDMFEHVCGRWTSVYPEQQDLFQILENRLRVSLLERADQATAGSDSAVDKAAVAITACMNVPEADIDHTGTIRDVLRRRGLTFPAQRTRSTREVFGILVALTLHDLLGVFFQLKLTPYLKTHDRLVFELKYAETMFRYVSDPEILESCVRAYDPNLGGIRDLAEKLHIVETDVRTITVMHNYDDEPPQYRKFSDIDHIYLTRTQQETQVTAQCHIPKSEGPLNFVVWLVEALRAVAAHKKRFLQPSPGDPSASINRDDWDLSGISVGAYYVVVYHIVYLPGSILMPPFLVPYGPDSYNYGAIGKVIGHELTHAFDPKFIDLSPKGEKHVFYSPRFFQQLREVQDCIILQANKLTQSAIAGNNSASEAFADSAGVEVAYLAYRALLESDRLTGAGYDTADQTFFAATCYMFCQAVEEYSEFSIYLPHRLRCKQPCLNTQEFANAFGCKEGSPMFPRHRCDVHDFLKITQGGKY
ncbi:hypothetical protein HPB50_009708 [Hyalomma asiaticum]|uniref:Uncharacterized protein n=1 Tax=Hyalomma asiaticum TaxID=266040 RepID=A0ACB7RTF8_HYAAI|nr:hypothetical protein HPB50_009708 [Hyalomma asiaticum]